MMQNEQLFHVLLVDDDDADLELTRLALTKSHGQEFEIQVAHSLAEAGEQLAHAAANRPFDVMLLDLGLPDSRGPETLLKMREIDDRTPIVVLTDLVDDTAAIESLNQGAQDYVRKEDLAVGSLSRSIRYAIQRQLMMQQLADTNQLLADKNDHLARVCETAQKFVDNVSHEFRTPLTVIKEYVSLLRDGVVGTTALDAEQCQFLDVIADRADDLNTMVDDMLDVSKLKAGILGAWRQVCRIENIIQRVAPGLSRKAGVKRVSLETSMDAGLPEVFCDPEKIARVIINLTVNAIKFCREPGEVRIWARCSGNGTEIEVGVSDNGPGINEEEREAIFERFKQAGTSERHGGRGFGLGLHIARELVELNFGTLKLESTLGEGSTFYFTLPIAEPVVVTERYLRQVPGPPSECGRFMSLLQAQIPGNAGGRTFHEIEALLNYVLQGNELLFQTAPGTWLLVTPLCNADLDYFLQRLQRVRDETNRNRPQGPLPDISVEVVGCWEVPRQESALLATLGQFDSSGAGTTQVSATV